MNETLGPRFEQALAYAHTVHAAQRRKGGDIPYIAHLLAVAGLVIEDAAGTEALVEDEVIAALLHDAAEDQGGEERLADIRTRFGDRVADVVAACSDTFEKPKPRWQRRKKTYLDAPPRRGRPGHPARLGGRQGPQRARDPRRLPSARRWAVETFRPRGRHALVLPRARADLRRAPAGTPRRPAPAHRR